MSAPGPRPRLRRGSAWFLVWLVVLWVFLWGELTLANVVTGVAVAAVLLVAVPRPAATGDDPRIRPLALLSFLGWFAYKLVEANLRVAAEVLRPPSRSRIRTGIVAVPLPGCPAGIATAVADAITLTPGTLTIEVEPTTPVLYVHVLQLTSADEARREVYEVERRIVAAVGSDAARRAVAERPAAGAAAPLGEAP